MSFISCDAGIGLLYFGTLRKMECGAMQKKDDVVKEDHADATLDEPTKRRFKGLTHKIHGWMIGSFKICVPQLGKIRDESSRLMSNVSRK